jgi:hypothetical protein
MSSVVRVSILTIPEDGIDEAAEAMRRAEQELKGIQKLPGLHAYFAGVDRADSQLTNVSVWDSIDRSPISNACGSGVKSADPPVRCDWQSKVSSY